MDKDSAVNNAENAMTMYEELRDQIDPVLAYSWRSDSKTKELFDKTEKRLISIAGMIETSSKVLKNELNQKKELFNAKMNTLWTKIHHLDEKSKSIAEEIQKYYKERTLTLKERVKSSKDAAKNEIESIQTYITLLEKDRATVESYLSEIRSKTK